MAPLDMTEHFADDIADEILLRMHAGRFSQAFKQRPVQKWKVHTSLLKGELTSPSRFTALLV